MDEVQLVTDEELAEWEQAWGDADIDRMVNTIRQERAEVARLRGALGFYADLNSWKNWWYCDPEDMCLAVKDEGDKARAALGVEKRYPQAEWPAEPSLDSLVVE